MKDSVIRLILKINSLLLIASLSFGNSFEIKWFNYQRNKLLRIDFANQKVYQENVRLGRFDEIGSLETTHPEITSLDCNFFIVREFNIKGRPIISIKGTSLVYHLIQKNEKFYLRRLDNSQFKGFNFFAYQFVRKDTLFSIGGYGFWRYDNTLTYFDEKNKGWEIYNFKNEGPEVIAYDVTGYDTIHDGIWTLNFIDPKKLSKGESEQHLFFFNFKNSLWTKKGKVEKSVFARYNVSIERAQWIQNKFFFNINEGSLLVDPFSNHIKLFDETKNRNFLSPAEIYTHNDSLYFYQPVELNPFEKYQKYKFDTKKTLSFFKPLDEKFYVPDTVLSNFQIGSLLFIFFAALIVFWNIKNLKRNSSVLSEREISFLNLLNSSPNGLSTDDLNIFLDIDKKNIDIQKNQRNNFIKDLHAKFQVKYNIENIIERRNSANDKRFIRYYLNEKHALLVKQILKGKSKN